MPLSVVHCSICHGSRVLRPSGFYTCTVCDRPAPVGIAP